MSSVVPGFEYDIFISYRHNDNRSGWVTEFVNALQEELAATIKEPLTIYFDKNPHDGLLETHDVDDSLKDKLKCLIFIPIISRTYCDTKSFAWNQEFLPFLKMAADDSIGLKVKLPNGNTASRVLPIRIHELDANDKGMIEAELQGVLRAIDFTYKAAGINRPLLSKDDEAIKTLGQATYRDQINKTANAISDLIGGMQGRVLTSAEITSGNSHQSVNQEPRRNKTFKIPAFSKLQIAISVITLLFLLLVGLSLIHFSETTLSPTYKATILPPENTKFSNYRGGNFALSPDGSMMAFVAQDSSGKGLLYVRSLNVMEARELKGTEGALRPFWSPDSRFIGFFADGKLKKIDVADGPALALCNANPNRGGSWNKDGVIIFGATSYLSRVSAIGSTPSRVTLVDTAKGELTHRWPLFFPDGEHFFYTASSSSDTQEDAIYIASLDSTFKPKMIVKASSSLSFANGYLIYHKRGTLLAQRFDEDKLLITGDPTPIADQVFYDVDNSNVAFSVSQNGLLAYQSNLDDGKTDFMWYDRNGNRIGNFSKTADFNSFLISPDGKKIAVTESNPDKEGRDIWLYEIDRDAWMRCTFSGNNFSPVWSPDSKMIAYSSDKRGRFERDIYLRAASGADKEKPILETSESKHPSDWSSDGKFITYTSRNDIWILPMSTSDVKATGQPFPFLQSEFQESKAVFSPDGRWIAYESNESGRWEVYIRPFPGPGGKWQVSTKGGLGPRWRGDGKELFFVYPDLPAMMSVGIKTSDATVDVADEQQLFKFGVYTVRDYDVTRDGQKFLFAASRESERSMPVTLVVNWLEGLKKN